MLLVQGVLSLHGHCLPPFLMPMEAPGAAATRLGASTLLCMIRFISLAHQLARRATQETCHAERVTCDQYGLQENRGYAVACRVCPSSILSPRGHGALSAAGAIHPRSSQFHLAC